MSVSVFDNVVLGGLLSDDKITAYFHIDAEIEAMLRFEVALAEVEDRAGLVQAGTGQAVRRAVETFEPDLEALRLATQKDGVCVPELVRQLRSATGQKHGPDIHYGATSQDVVDTALVLRLKPVLEELQQRLVRLDASFGSLNDRFGAREIMGQTRMQRALMIRCADKITTWQRPVQNLLAALPELRVRLLRLQFGGPVGTLQQLGDRAAEISANLADALGLADDGCWHTDRSSLTEFADWLSRATGALGKMGQDVALMAQNELHMVRLAGGGASSAMAHKQNPVSAEKLVTLGRFNATLVSGMHQALVHENERSGAAWTLEWMLLPQMVVAGGAALNSAIDLIGNIEEMGE